MCNRYCFLALIIFITACSPGKTNKQPDHAKTDFSLPAGNVEAGKIIYNSTCKTCHGVNGEGNKEFLAPALVNTDAWYLHQQLVNYRNGLRGYSEHDTSGIQMAAMAKTLKDSIAINDVVSYIKTMPAIVMPPSMIGDRKTGENIYQSVCGSCHGPNASGNQKLNAPRLSGLQEWYLKQQLSNFKTSVRGTHPQDTFGAQMVSMVEMLPDQKSIDDVVAYILSETKPVSK